MSRQGMYLIFTGFFLSTSCLMDEPFKRPYDGYGPRDIKDEWRISTPSSENMDANVIEKAYRIVYKDSRFPMARSLLIVRNGSLVAEAYPHDKEDIHKIHHIQSCTKSFTSILAGIALNRGLIDSVDQEINNIFPEYFENRPDKTGITIKNCLNMTGGLEFDNNSHTLALYQTKGSSVDYVLSRKRIHDPGVVFHYNDGMPHLVSAAIGKTSGKTLEEFAGEYLFLPLGITEWKWEHAHDGVTYGAFGLYLKPRDFAKFGQLLLQNGKWDGKSIVDSAWIAQASAGQITANGMGSSYGYYFWNFPAYPGYAALGHGGQRLYVIPSLRLVVVYTAWPYTSGMFFDDLSDVMDLIISACD